MGCPSTTCSVRGEDGFTLLEVTVGLAVTAVAFVALAGAMLAGLKSLAVQKARTQGNEVATQGIEDLQRLGFNYLGTCGTPPAPVPADFATPANLANCPATPNAPAVTATYGRPGDGTAGCAAVLGTIPAMFYQCERNNVVYEVRRYVAWTDSAQTTKRMAVFVGWRDNVGFHTVSQQSSLRSPNEASVIGLPPPAFVSVAVSSSISRVSPTDGSLQSGDITLQATTTGLADTVQDKVSVSFTTIEEVEPAGSGVFTPVESVLVLSPLGTDQWVGNIVSGGPYRFGVGTQYFVFSGTRASDGKANSRVATDVHKFCPSGESSDCSVSSTLPKITATAAPSTVDIDPSGVLLSDFAVTATTERLTSTDKVRIIFQTQSGAYSLPLLATGCTGSECTWSTTVQQANALRFPAGPQYLFFTASQSDAPFSTAAQRTTAVVSFL